ncbi:hypothetical protein [Paraburkholderia sp. CNPSo 3281]
MGLDVRQETVAVAVRGAPHETYPGAYRPAASLRAQQDMGIEVQLLDR